MVVLTKKISGLTRKQSVFKSGQPEAIISCLHLVFRSTLLLTTVVLFGYNSEYMLIDMLYEKQVLMNLILVEHSSYIPLDVYINISMFSYRSAANRIPYPITLWLPKHIVGLYHVVLSEQDSCFADLKHFRQMMLRGTGYYIMCLKSGSAWWLFQSTLVHEHR